MDIPVESFFKQASFPPEGGNSIKEIKLVGCATEQGWSSSAGGALLNKVSVTLIWLASSSLSLSFPPFLSLGTFRHRWENLQAEGPLHNKNHLLEYKQILVFLKKKIGDYSVGHKGLQCMIKHIILATFWSSMYWEKGDWKIIIS